MATRTPGRVLQGGAGFTSALAHDRDHVLGAHLRRVTRTRHHLHTALMDGLVTGHASEGHDATRLVGVPGHHETGRSAHA